MRGSYAPAREAVKVAADRSLGRIPAMTLSLRVEKTLIVLALWAVFASGYFTLNAWNQTRETRTVEIELDERIPFQSAWVLPYIFVYVFILLPAPVVQHRGYFRAVARAYLGTMAAGFLVFAFFPVRYPRPELGGRIDGFLTWGVGLNYALDYPNNCFPSLHIAIAYLAAFACWRITRPVGAIGLAIATAIALSTLFIKQHYVLDIVAGLALAAATYAWFIVRGFRPGR